MKFLAFYYILTFSSVALYMCGFFPLTVVERRTPVQAPKTINDVTLNYYAGERNIVLLVIDALRVDFITPHLMPYTWSHLNYDGCLIDLKVESPTVTMPRIKALTTGTVPQFIDVVFNLAGGGNVHDSVLHRAFKKGKKIVFYGDNTWLQLFPDIFYRNEGTNSFFVNDFTEVDDNVTRNMREELEKHWDIMVLHYLGLDHIGHVYGPKHDLVPIKLSEMDKIIKEIHEGTNATVFITGDHGMKDSGGHGGSTWAETHVPLAILRLPCSNGSFDQTDLPTNLAALLNVEIPSTSIGKISKNLFSKWLSLEHYLSILRYNTIVLMQNKENCESFNLASSLHLEYLLKGDKSGQKAAEIYENCSDTISEKLIRGSVEQNPFFLIMALLVIVNLFLSLLLDQFNSIELTTMLFLIILQYSSRFKYLFVHTLLVFFKNLFFITKFRTKLKISNIFVVIHVLYLLSLMSSSYIEEEHQFWYFFAVSVCLFYYTKTFNLGLLLCTLGVRFIRTINQTGDKWANLADLSDWLLSHELCLQLFFIISLFLLLCCFCKLNKKIGRNIVNIWIILLIFYYKTYNKQSVQLGKTLWFLIFINNFFVKNSQTTWLLISAVLLKPYNVILLPAEFFASKVLQNLFNKNDLIISHLWLGNLLFFGQGHSNSLASIDISVGYIGLSTYNPLLVFPQVLCHCYLLKIFPFLLIYKKIDGKNLFKIFLIERLSINFVVFFITFTLRQHLFIWSVFSPKLLIECIHTFTLCFIFFIYYILSYIFRTGNKKSIIC